MTDKSNCLACNDFDCQLNPAQDMYDKPTKFHIKFARARIIITGCLSHSGAKEWLMKDVIEELKHKQANAQGEISHHFLDQDCYREGIIKTCKEVISLIRGDKP